MLLRSVWQNKIKDYYTQKIVVLLMESCQGDEKLSAFYWMLRSRQTENYECIFLKVTICVKITIYWLVTPFPCHPPFPWYFHLKQFRCFSNKVKLWSLAWNAKGFSSPLAYDVICRCTNIIWKTLHRNRSLTISIIMCISKRERI